MPRRHGSLIVPVAAMLVTSVLAACSGDSTDADRNGSTQAAETGTATSTASTADAADSGLTASVQQQRLDVGTRRIGLELTNTGSEQVHVSSVRLVSDAFAEQPPTPKDTVFAPGAVIDLVVEFGDPQCSEQASTNDAAVTVTYDVGGVEGSETMPVDRPGRGLLHRLHETYCDQELLEQAARLGYRLPFHRERVDGTTALVGTLTLTRPADGGSGQRVAVDSLLGSVLFDFFPLPQHDPSWGVLAPGDRRAILPVAIRSSDLCTQHARSQSQQTFLYSAYVTVGSHPQYRQIIKPPKRLQEQALALLDDYCGE